MIFVITGTERFPINRMVEEIDRLAGNKIINDNIFIQLGACTYEPTHCDWEHFLDFGHMCEKIKEADTVIAHAGAGTTLLCVQMGHHPILVPRRKKFGEHIDDHQLSFAKKFQTTNLVTVAYDIRDLAQYSLYTTRSNSSENQHNSRKQLVKYLDELL